MSFLFAGGKRLEARWIEGRDPLLVFLHEGLGCAGSWRDVPDELARATGCRALVYSRAGYGGSDPVELPRPLDYMQREGEGVLPELISGEHVLIGHSDGGSIAIAYAGSAHRPGLRGLILEAPHVFCEDISVESIRRVKEEFEHGDLRARLERRHGANVDVAFRGWNDAWLDPKFRAWNLEHYLPNIRVPILVIQGEQDPYGTMRQVEAIERGASAVRVDRLIVQNCGHAPHRDQRETALAAMIAFIGETQFSPRSTE